MGTMMTFYRVIKLVSQHLGQWELVDAAQQSKVYIIKTIVFSFPKKQHIR